MAVMRWAFVLQLASETRPSTRHFEGRIEEVDTGRELRFRSTDELLTFLGECFDLATHPVCKAHQDDDRECGSRI
jgi:hypothetical protein